MSEVAPFAGLPGDLPAFLVAVPSTDKSLLELQVGWGGLSPGLARMADALRVFVVSWDPLEWLGPRPDEVGTVNADPLELVVYVPIWSLTGADPRATVAGALGAVAGSAVVVAAAHEEVVVSGAYPLGVREGRLPPLLSERDAGAALGRPEVRLVSPGWEPIGLGAIIDIVVDAFGPVELDRSPVELSAAHPVDPACPACTGSRFGFPAGLGDARDSLCPAHRAEADAVTAERLGAAQDSNADGMGALGDACARLERPHLPNGLLGRLAGAEETMLAHAEPDRLAAWAGALIEAAGWFPARDEDLALALGAEPDMPWLPEWTLNMVLDLGRVGLGELAAEVGAALATVDVANASVYAADVGVALAEAGLGEAALEKIADNLAAWPDDFWVRVHAGDALVELDDFDGAEVHFVAALEMADDADGFQSLSDANERLAELRRRWRKAQKAHRRASPTARAAPGDPCPCGSGSKFKHCHGRQRRRR